MSKSARQRLHALGLPEELSYKIMNDTPYGDWSKPVIEFAGVELIMDRYVRILQSVQKEYPMMDHSWLIEIIEQFIVLLKIAPVTNSMVKLLVKLVYETKYLTESQVYKEYEGRDKYREEVDAFIQNDEYIQQHALHPNFGKYAKRITNFFDKVVIILSGAFDTMTEEQRFSWAQDDALGPDSLYDEIFMWEDARDASRCIHTCVLNMQYIFIKLRDLITNNRPVTKNLTFKKMLDLELPDWIKREQTNAATKIQRFVRSKPKHGGTKTKRSGIKRNTNQKTRRRR